MIKRIWPALYGWYHHQRQKRIVREQRRRVLEYLMMDTDYTLAVLQEHTQDTLKNDADHY